MEVDCHSCKQPPVCAQYLSDRVAQSPTSYNDLHLEGVACNTQVYTHSVSVTRVAACVSRPVVVVMVITLTDDGATDALQHFTLVQAVWHVGREHEYV